MVGDHDVGQGEGSHCTVVALDSGKAWWAGCLLLLWSYCKGRGYDDRDVVDTFILGIIQD